SLVIELDGTGVTAGAVCPAIVGEAGMWFDSGAKAPRLLREVSPQQCADAVLKVIRGSREALVNPGPMRPLLAVAEIAPALPAFVIKRLGILDTLRERARKTEARDGGRHP